MPYILRILQRFHPEDRAAYMQVEAQFAAMERRRDDFPKGRRSQPCIGREPTNTLIWESEFTTQEDAHAAIRLLSADAEHEALFQQQVKYVRDAYVEVSEVLEF